MPSRTRFFLNMTYHDSIRPVEMDFVIFPRLAQNESKT